MSQTQRPSDPDIANNPNRITTGDFRGALEAILSESLDPKTIDTYAERALDNVVDLIGKVVLAYRLESGEHEGAGSELEDVAFSHYGLGDVDQILHQLIQKVNQLRSYDEIIAHIEGGEVNGVILPTSGKINIAPDSVGRGFERQASKPKLKTLLLVLDGNFGINPADPDRLILANGTVKPSMMRRESYVIAEIPELDRTVLICDEEGNATYVLDSQLLIKLGLTREKLIALSKQGLNRYIDEQSGLGKSLKDTKNFVINLSEALRNLTHTTEDSNSDADKLLLPMAPDNVSYGVALAKKWGVSESTLAKVKDSLGIKGQTYRFQQNDTQGRTTVSIREGYDESQQQAIRAELDRRGLLERDIRDSIDAGDMTVSDMTNQLGVAEKAVYPHIKKLGLEPIYWVRGSRRLTGIYSKGQFEQIKASFNLEGSLKDVPIAPEGYKTIHAVLKDLGVGSRHHVYIREGIIEKGRLGDIGVYRNTYRGMRDSYLSPDQQRALLEVLSTDPDFSGRVLGKAAISALARLDSPAFA